MIEDDLAILGGGDLEGDTAGDIGFDQTSDHVDGGALGGEQQVNPGSSSELGDADDGLLHALPAGEHEVGKLVDDDYDAGEEVAAVIDALLSHEGVPTVHDGAELLQLFGSTAHVGDDRAVEEVAQAIPPTELHLLGVDHDELAIAGGIVVAEGADDRVDEDGLTRACGACNESMRYGAEVEGEKLLSLGHTQQCGECIVSVLCARDELGEVDRAGLIACDLEGEVGLRAGHHDDLAVEDRRETFEVMGDFGELEGILQIEMVARELGAGDGLRELGFGELGEVTGDVLAGEELRDGAALVLLEEIIRREMITLADVHGVPHLISLRSSLSSRHVSTF